jgi:hypothetical protein
VLGEEMTMDVLTDGITIDEELISPVDTSPPVPPVDDDNDEDDDCMVDVDDNDDERDDVEDEDLPIDGSTAADWQYCVVDIDPFHQCIGWVWIGSHRQRWKRREEKTQFRNK